MKPTRLLSFALALALAAVSRAPGQEAAEVSKWKNHESLKTPEIARADWEDIGKGSKMQVTDKGLHLVGNSRVASNFKLADGGSIRFVYTANNRNAIVHLCGEEFKVKAPDKKGPELYVLLVARQGRALRWEASVIDVKGRPVGTPIKGNAIQLEASAVAKPSRVVFRTEPVHGRGDANSIGDVFFKSILVNGPVVPPPAAEAAKAEMK